MPFYFIKLYSIIMIQSILPFLLGNEDLIDSNTGEYLGKQKMGSTLHWGASSGENRWYLTTDHTFNDTNPYTDDFHQFIVDWDENGIR